MGKSATILALAIFIGGVLFLGREKDRNSSGLIAQGAISETGDALEQTVAAATLVAGFILYATVPVFRLAVNVVLAVLLGATLLKRLAEDR